MLTLKSATFNEATTGYEKTYLFTGNVEDTLLQEFGTKMVTSFAEGSHPLTVSYGTVDVFSAAELVTLKNYAADQISHEFMEPTS